jgi:hypothetical protein
MEDGGLVEVASAIAGFGSALLVFRIQRELQMRGKEETTWVPWADRLLLAATLVSLLLVILPLVALSFRPGILQSLPAASCAASVVMLAGYVPSILAHYRLLFGTDTSGPRANPEPAERVLVWIAAGLGITVFLLILLGVL